MIISDETHLSVTVSRTMTMTIALNKMVTLQDFNLRLSRAEHNAEELTKINGTTTTFAEPIKFASGAF